ncbi:MAG TPA: glycosyl hydrolase [Ignavibacteriaceae bacterium]|nr:glycosyl hydrolase [Ignavibacteriaceae bacterium]
MRFKFSVLIVLVIFTSFFSFPQNFDTTSSKDKFSTSTFNGLKFRLLGSASTSGRVTDFAVNPNNFDEFYVGVACGNVWKTTNLGTTWEPIFDNYGSFSIGCITIDPTNTNVVYVGTGENNSQRSVSWGDGIYRSEDGGKSFKNIGLKKSEHIAKILIDPRDNKVIYVAAQGPLWGPGGDRGLFKSTDYGATWDSVLYISPNTGVTDVVMDTRNPDVLYAATYQRRRHVWTLLNGGPESAVYKSTDAGKTWNKLTNGLPSGDVGRIGLAISPINPDYVYAIIEAANDGGGFFRTTNRGATWEKMGSYVVSSAQYYSEIFCDPLNVDKVFILDTFSSYTTDGGKTYQPIGNNKRHVDDHAFWINPHNTNNFMIGCDGGVYITYDHAKNWRFVDNLPITQFYRVSVDNNEPFYRVMGGTQDNASMIVPSQTINEEGIVNADWIPLVGGDGYEAVADPSNSNIIYCEWQYGGLTRYDMQSGEMLSIKPQEKKGNAPYRWNWDTPLIVSPHSKTRIYTAANKVFRSDDRGDTWQVISEDLTAQIDRNKLPVMDKIWSVDAVAKNASTSFYGNIVSLTESPLVEGLIYAGTDDGLIQVTEDGGKNWRKIESFPGIPKNTYVSCLYASQHDANTVYASFDNHKLADFKPYILISKDRGKSWEPITGNLKEPQVIYSIVQDHINSEMLFIGTEYGVFFTNDGGKKWIQLKGNLPTIAVRDLDIQKRENDLVLGTFGRGFYVLDNYSPLRDVSEKILTDENYKLFPVKDALMFVKRSATFGSYGSGFYKADNPPFGATFTYYIKEVPKTKREQRQEKEKDLIKKNEPVYYPTWDELRTEDNEEKPFLLFTIYDDAGNVIRKLKSNVSAGINRFTWDLRYASTNPVKKAADENASGYPVMPGKYKVTMSISVDGVLTQVAGPVEFEAKVLNNVTLPAVDRSELVAFQKKVSELNRAVDASIEVVNDLRSKIEIIKTALKQTPKAPQKLMDDANLIADKSRDIYKLLVDDETLSKRNEPTPPTIAGRLGEVTWGMWQTTSAPTNSYKENYRIASEEFKPILNELKQILEVDLKNLEYEMDNLSAPWTPGRVPDWKE